MRSHLPLLLALATLSACTAPEPAGVLFTEATLLGPTDDVDAAPRDLLFVDGALRAPTGADVPLRTVDAAGQFLHPGLADAHVHLPDSTLWERTFLLHLLNGVTSLRSMRGEMWHAEVDTSGALVPRLYLGSPPIVAQDSAADVDSLLAAYAAADFSFVKVLSVANDEHFVALTAASRAHGLPLAGHYPRNVDTALVRDSAPFESYEHLGGADCETDFDSATYHCPTLDWYYGFTTFQDSMRQRAGASYLPDSVIAAWEAEYAEFNAETDTSYRRRFRTFYADNFAGRLETLACVPEKLLLLSPDASGPYGVPGFSMLEEMAHYARAGLSPKRILRAATENYGRMVGEESARDYVLLAADPRVDVANARAVEGVLLKGRYYGRAELEGMLEAFDEG